MCNDEKVAGKLHKELRNLEERIERIEERLENR
jgi:hypothetical protein